MAATNLLDHGVPIDEVQDFVGHADPRTTRLYRRSKRKSTRNLVERISIRRPETLAPDPADRGG